MRLGNVVTLGHAVAVAGVGSDRHLGRGAAHAFR